MFYIKYIMPKAKPSHRVKCTAVILFLGFKVSEYCCVLNLHYQLSLVLHHSSKNAVYHNKL